MLILSLINVHSLSADHSVMALWVVVSWLIWLMHVAVDMMTVAVAIACTARSHTQCVCKIGYVKKILPVTATISFQNPTKLNSYYARLGNTWKCIRSTAHSWCYRCWHYRTTWQQWPIYEYIQDAFLFALSLSSKIVRFMLHLCHSFFNRFNYNQKWKRATCIAFVVKEKSGKRSKKRKRATACRKNGRD